MYLASHLLKVTLRSISPVATQHYSKMLEEVVGVYKEVAGISEVKEARILSVKKDTKDVMLEVTWSSRNLATKERTQTISNYLVRSDVEGGGGAGVITFPPVPIDKNVLLRRTSNSGRLTACVVGGARGKVEGSGEGKECAAGEHIIVTDHNGVFMSFDLSSADKHGKVYADVEFSSLEFSPDETKLAYIAEKRQAKASSFLAPPPKSGEEDMRGQEYAYREDWGEQLVGQSESAVCILDLTTGLISAHTLPDALCPGQLTFLPGKAGMGPSGKNWSLVGVGFASQPYRLGLIYCQNRESQLFHLDSEGKIELLGSSGYNVLYPRWSPDGSRVAFVRSAMGGPHSKAGQLCVYEWSSKQERVLIDVVNRERECPGSPVFRGVYGAIPLPRRCWDSDGRSIIFSGPSLDMIATYVVCVQSGELAGLGECERSRQVWDVCGDVVLLEETSLCSPGRLFLAPRPLPQHVTGVQMKQVTRKREVCDLPESYLTRWIITNPTPHPKPKYSDVPISLMYLGPPSCPKGTPKRPLIVLPHGGPHTCFTNAFTASYAFFTRLGFSVLLPNYRGSTGAGQDGIDSLPGHCGVIDVSDVYQATLSCLARFPDVLDEKQVYLFGGSHGGFLVAHLAAQYPDLYTTTVMRNPSTDYVSALAVKDNPDMCFVESGFDFRHGMVPDASTMAQMMALSPISRIDTLTAPTLLLIGKDDQRVPPSQGLNFHKMLRARGVETELHLYPDCHPLSKVGVEADCLIHTALWFHKHGAMLPSLGTPVSAS